MKITYAFRRSAFYPFDDHGGPGNELPPPDIRRVWLPSLHARGFEGVEVGVQPRGTSDATIRDLGKELADAGVPAAVIRGGGGFASPRAAHSSRERVERATHQAHAIGCNLVNMTVSTPASDPTGSRTSGLDRMDPNGEEKLVPRPLFPI